jgi:hypothetical protein
MSITTFNQPNSNPAPASWLGRLVAARGRSKKNGFIASSLVAILLLAGCSAAAGANLAPHATVATDSNVRWTGQNFEFDARASSDPDGSITAWHFEFGDGQTEDAATRDAARVWHAYAHGGEYTMTLTVSDNGRVQEGRLTATATQKIAVNERVPLSGQVVNASLAQMRYTGPFVAYSGVDRFFLVANLTSLLPAGTSGVQIRVLDATGAVVGLKTIAVGPGETVPVTMDGPLTVAGNATVEFSATAGAIKIEGGLTASYDAGFPAASGESTAPSDSLASSSEPAAQSSSSSPSSSSSGASASSSASSSSATSTSSSSTSTSSSSSTPPSPPAGPPTVNLNSAASFAILAETGITTTGATSIVGNLGVSPIAGTSMTGFTLVMDGTNQFSTSPLVTGRVYAADYATPTPAVLSQAISDLQAAYADAAGRTGATATELGAGAIGGMTLAPGLYTWSSTVAVGSNLVLSGGPNDVWIFQIAQTLNVAPGVHVMLSGGAQAKNVFWQVAAQVTLGTYADFNGNILTQTAIVFNTGASLTGRALAETAVTLDANAVTKAS